ncbi:hypothetical protein MKW92_034017 [Papaver armeniacum]|nr:hypothetical protein MKW92_034017 [Papaver armeniacum]
MNREFGSGYPGGTFKFLQFSTQFIDLEADKTDGDGDTYGKRQPKLSSLGFTGGKWKIDEIGSSGKGLCTFSGRQT